MKPAPFNLEFTRGDSFELFSRVRDTVYNETTGQYEPGPYKDITGWIGLSQMRASVDATEVLITFTVTVGNQVTAPGSFFVRATDEQTALVNVNGVWDCQFTTPAGDVLTVVGGKATCNKDVSRSG